MTTNNADLTELENKLENLLIQNGEDSSLVTDLRATIEELRESRSMLAAIRAARSNHPRCDKYSEGSPITCGWKRAVQDIDSVLGY